MAISTTEAFSGPYITNGATKAFPFTFAILNGAHLAVVLRTASGEETVVPSASYGVTLNGNGPADGTVTFTAAPVAGYSLYIHLAPPFTQETAFENGSAWLAGPVNDVNDMAALRDIVLARDVGRAIMAPIGEVPAALPPRADRAGHYLAFNGSGDPVASSGTGADAGLRADLAANGGAGLVTFLPGITGATGRSVQAKLRDSVCVSDAGAAGDGEANDAPAIQAAVNYAALLAAARGSMVAVCLSGCHAIATGITVPANVWLRGPGMLRARPATITLALGAIPATLVVGDAVEGLTSGATATVATLPVGAASMTVNNVTGDFVVGESVRKVGGGTAYTITGITGFPFGSPLVRVQSGGWLTDMTIDANSLATAAVLATDTVGAKMLRLKFLNWIYALTVENSARGVNSLETTDVEVGWIELDTPAANPIYPVWFAAKATKRIRRAKIHDITATGRVGAAYGVGGTADQLELQGLADSDVWNVGSRDGGELGFAIVRGSEDVRAWNITASGADADGIQIGSAYYELTLSGLGALVAGDHLTGLTSGALGVIDTIWPAQNMVALRAVSGVWAAGGETAKQSIRIRCDSVTGFHIGETLTGGTSGAKGVIIRIVDPENPKSPKNVYLDYNGVDTIAFVNGETVTNGTVTHTIAPYSAVATATGVDHVPGLASTTNVTATAAMRARDIRLDNATCYNNGTDVHFKAVTMTAEPVLWAVGDILTGGTSAATATITGINGLVVYLATVVGTFQVAESVSNGTNAYTIGDTGGYFAGIKVQHMDNFSLRGAECYDTRTPKLQKYGIYYANVAGIFESGNNFGYGTNRNLRGERSVNGLSSFAPTSIKGALLAEGAFAWVRGANLTVTANAITPVTGYHHIDNAAGAVSIKSITGTYNGQVLVLGISVDAGGAAGTVTIEDAGAGGNIDLPANFVMDKTSDRIALIYQSTNARWRQLSSADNA